jgi:putative FmdB family regulatory protein
MPLYKYKCDACDFIDEYIVDVEDQNSVQICEECGGLANYYPFFRFRHIGPVFADLMEIEDRLLTRKQKQAGMRIRDHRDVRKWEKDNKVTACTEQEIKEGREYHEDMAAMQQKVISTGGHDAWADEVDRMDIQEKTGWSDGQYDRWKTMTDTAQKDVGNDADAK